MKPQIETIAPAMLALPGAHQLTLVGIRWASAPTQDELDHVARMSATMSRVCAWVEGDYLLEHVRTRQNQDPGALVRTIVREYAEAHSSEPSRCLERYAIAKFWRFPERRSALSWSHHRVVWAALADDVHAARATLAAADRNQLTIVQLKELLRARADAPSEPIVEATWPLELQSAEDWWSGRLDEIDRMPPDRARYMLENLSSVASAIDRLRARAGSFQRGATEVI